MHDVPHKGKLPRCGPPSCDLRSTVHPVAICTALLLTARRPAARSSPARRVCGTVTRPHYTSWPKYTNQWGSKLQPAGKRVYALLLYTILVCQWRQDCSLAYVRLPSPSSFAIHSTALTGLQPIRLISSRQDHYQIGANHVGFPPLLVQAVFPSATRPCASAQPLKPPQGESS